MTDETTQSEQCAESEPKARLEALVRRPLRVGNVYRFNGYKGNGFLVMAMSLPGTDSDDGGLPGVAVKWLNRTRCRGWYPFASEREFWEHPLFSNACDPEAA